MAGDASTRRRVLMGTTGWTDASWGRCGKFFPPSSRSAEDRLRYYSTQFPCVEVDSSNYAIPTKSSIQRWLGCVPKGFLLHFKVFGFFCSKSCPFGALPYQVKNQLQCPRDSTVRLSSLSESQKLELWHVFNDALLPVYQCGSLGAVVFQFHLNFKPSEEHKAHVMWCRSNLDPRYSMAVEFRCRDWFNGQHGPETVQWLSENTIALVAADELEHETFSNERSLDSEKLEILPVAWACTDSSYMYIRLHRREGKDRTITSTELSTWEDRLKNKLPSTLKGPVYFIWGTMWEDQAVVNARNLAQRIDTMVLDWKSMQLASSKSNLQRFLKPISTNAKSLEPATDHIEGVGKGDEDAHDFRKDVKDPSSSTGGTDEFLFESSMQSAGSAKKGTRPTSMQEDSMRIKIADDREADNSRFQQHHVDRSAADSCRLEGTMAVPSDDGVRKESQKRVEQTSSDQVHVPTSCGSQQKQQTSGSKTINPQPSVGIKCKPKSLKRKENPNLRTSNITAFFKPASQ